MEISAIGGGEEILGVGYKSGYVQVFQVKGVLEDQIPEVTTEEDNNNGGLLFAYKEHAKNVQVVTISEDVS